MYKCTVNLKFNDISNLVDEHKVHGTEVANNSCEKMVGSEKSLLVSSCCLHGYF